MLVSAKAAKLKRLWANVARPSASLAEMEGKKLTIVGDVCELLGRDEEGQKEKQKMNQFN